MINPQFTLQIWRRSGLIGAVAEHQFHPDRKWRFDFAFIKQKVAIEVQGGIFMRRGGHNTGMALRREHEKRNAAAVLCWRILYCEPREVCTLEFINTIRAAVLNY